MSTAVSSKGGVGGDDKLPGLPKSIGRYVVESLVGKGYQLRVHDTNVEMSRIIGANKQFLEEEVPYIPQVLTPTLADVTDWAEVLVIANKSAEYAEVATHLRPDQSLVDLVRISDTPQNTAGKYVGLCW